VLVIMITTFSLTSAFGYNPVTSKKAIRLATEEVKLDFELNYAPYPETIQYEKNKKVRHEVKEDGIFKIYLKGTGKSTIGKMVSFTVLYEVNNNTGKLRIIDWTK